MSLFVVFVALELKEAAEKAQAQYRSEKQQRKEMELRGNNMEEELQDLKADKESLERVSTHHFLSPVNLLLANASLLCVVDVLTFHMFYLLL